MTLEFATWNPVSVTATVLWTAGVLMGVSWPIHPALFAVAASLFLTYPVLLALGHAAGHVRITKEA